MLAQLAPDELDAYMERGSLRAYSDRTVVSAQGMHDILDHVRMDGYSLVDEELGIGLRSLAVPVWGASGAVPAALNVGVQVNRVSAAQMIKKLLPVLIGGAQDPSVLLP